MAEVLKLESVTKHIGNLTLFEDVNLVLNKGEKAALLGSNGTGKTTLLNLITKKDSPDEGLILLNNKLTTAYLPQEPFLDNRDSVFDAVYKSDNALVKQIKEYERIMLKQEVKELEKAITNMDRLKLWDFETRIKQMLTQLEIIHFDQKIGDLSGGQKKRIALANALLNEPDLLILDEPTNHLDINLIEWLENYLNRSAITLLLVTHDRFFLDRICSVIFEIDQKQLYRYEANYSRFIEQRAKRIEHEKLEVEKAKNLLRKEEDWMQRMPKARGTKAKYRIDAYYKLREVSKQKRTEKQINLNVKESRLGSKILVAKNLDFTWNGKYYLKNFSYTFSRFEKIGIMGSNGSGKSTFLDIIMKNLQPEKGSIETGETIRFGYYRQEGIQFDKHMKVLDAATNTAETVQGGDGSRITASQFLTNFLFSPKRQHDYIYKLSGGEKRRLYLCQVLMQNPNFLILDEPTNDFDIKSLQVLEEYLSSFNGCTLVVSHDRCFMDHVIDHLFVFHEDGVIKDFPGNYSAYYLWKKEKEKNERKPEERQTKKKRVAEKNKNKLSYKEKQELEQLEIEIENLESEKLKLEEALSSGQLSSEELTEKSERIGKIIEVLEKKSDRWLVLSEKL